MEDRISKTGARLVAGALGVVALLAGASAPRAANLNTHGTACQPASGSTAADFSYSEGGIVNNATGSRVVLCPVPRSPLASGAINGSFYVDGGNPTAGTSTSCSLVSFEYTGVLIGASTFTASATTYDQLVTLPAAQLTTFAYVTLFCSLPPHGVLLGVTSLQ